MLLCLFACLLVALLVCSLLVLFRCVCSFFVCFLFVCFCLFLSLFVRSIHSSFVCFFVCEALMYEPEERNGMRRVCFFVCLLLCFVVCCVLVGWFGGCFVVRAFFVLLSCLVVCLFVCLCCVLFVFVLQNGTRRCLFLTVMGVLFESFISCDLFFVSLFVLMCCFCWF